MYIYRVEKYREEDHIYSCHKVYDFSEHDWSNMAESYDFTTYEKAFSAIPVNDVSDIYTTQAYGKGLLLIFEQYLITEWEIPEEDFSADNFDNMEWVGTVYTSPMPKYITIGSTEYENDGKDCYWRIDE